MACGSLAKMSRCRLPSTGAAASRTLPEMPWTWKYRPSGTGKAMTRRSIEARSISTGAGAAAAPSAEPSASTLPALAFVAAAVRFLPSFSAPPALPALPPDSPPSFFSGGTPSPFGGGTNGEGRSAFRVTRHGMTARGKPRSKYTVSYTGSSTRAERK